MVIKMVREKKHKWCFCGRKLFSSMVISRDEKDKDPIKIKLACNNHNPNIVYDDDETFEKQKLAFLNHYKNRHPKITIKKMTKTLEKLMVI